MTTIDDIDLDEVADRLRSTRQKWIENEEIAGAKHGLNWAANEADFSELKSLFDEANQGWPHEDDSIPLAKRVDEIIGCEQPEFSLWYSADTDKVEYPSDEYVSAFVDAAREVWDNVKDRI